MVWVSIASLIIAALSFLTTSVCLIKTNTKDTTKLLTEFQSDIKTLTRELGDMKIDIKEVRSAGEKNAKDLIEVMTILKERTA